MKFYEVDGEHFLQKCKGKFIHSFADDEYLMARYFDKTSDIYYKNDDAQENIEQGRYELYESRRKYVYNKAEIDQNSLLFSGSSSIRFGSLCLKHPKIYDISEVEEAGGRQLFMIEYENSKTLFISVYA